MPVELHSAVFDANTMPCLIWAFLTAVMSEKLAQPFLCKSAGWRHRTE